MLGAAAEGGLLAESSLARRHALAAKRLLAREAALPAVASGVSVVGVGDGREHAPTMDGPRVSREAAR